MALGLAPGASAQYGDGARSGQQRPMSVDVEAVVRPHYLSSDLETITEMGRLDEGQVVVAETLFLDFNESFTAGVQKLRVALQQARPGSLSGGTLEGMRHGQSQYDARMRTLQESLSRDLRAAENAQERQILRDAFAEAVERLTLEQSGIEARAGDESGWEEFLALQTLLLQDWVEQREVLEADLLLGIELILEPHQLEGWARAQQTIRRRDMPSENAFGGEGLDLDARVRRLELGEDVMTMLEPNLQAYAASIDEAVRARSAYLLQAVPATSAALAASDWGSMKAIIQQEAAHRSFVRDRNLQWIGNIVDVLPEPHRTMFLDDVRLSAFGTAWNAGRAERIFEAALQRDDLTDAERSRLERLRDECRSSRLPLQMQHQSLLVREAPDKWILDQERRWAKSFSGGELERKQIRSDDSTALQNELSSVEDQCSESIKELLGADRYKELPGTQTRPRRAGDGRRGDRTDESMRRRDELYKRFDSNGDGRLDADERRRMRDTLQNELGGRP